MIKLIVIKQYQEFTETVHIPLPEDDIPFLPEEGFPSEERIVAKEVEAVIQREDDTTFSIGFSVQRDNPIFEISDPRNMVRKFLLEIGIK
jgi:hypothetical protein